ncbi:hypothetical protein [Radiobacillus sp. PE A8.2]|uniref:hypothetical protein n=1 Tax=Radiobacillus sp. PE A8.2 TaxID=3380349 RepID=UPI0038909D16
MDEVRSKDDIIRLLLNCLPDLSMSVNEILNLAQGFMDDLEPEVDINLPDRFKSQTGKQLFTEVEKTLELLRKDIKDFEQVIESIKSDRELTHYYKMYTLAISDLLKSFSIIYSIFLGESVNTEDDMDKFINHLYEGAQKIIDLVNIITD